MDKYEYNLIIDQIRQAVEQRDIDTAVKLADEIDWRKEKDVSVLIILADAYELSKNHRLAKEILLLAYEKAQGGRQLAYRLAILSAKVKEFDEAEEFYQDFVDMAPRDTARYILRYRIAREKKAPVEKLIEILEEYVDIDMEEKWMYELAKLYHIAGDEENCVDLCDEMSLWFSHGKYVRKAMDLKKLYRPLTKRQEENYNKTDDDFVVKEEKTSEAEAVQAGAADEAKAVSTEAEDIKAGATIPFTIVRADNATNKSIENVKDDSEDTTIPQKEETKISKEEPVPQEEEEVIIPGEIDIEDIHLKPLEGDGLDTMDLQAEIAKNMKEIMDSEEQMEEADSDKEEVQDKLSMTLDPLFKYDADGQIGLDIKQPKPAEKQITGQLSIEEVLRSLEERGILKSDTVNKTVETMDHATEAVDKAAEEAAIKAEQQKENETIIQDYEAKDLAEDGEMDEVESALESYADDTINGFVFTEEIDSDAIEKVLKGEETISVPEAGAEDASIVEMDIEDSEPVELANDIPILDLSFETPVKKLHTGITPDSKPVTATTASLKELFADLDEATKRELGIIDDDQQEQAEAVTEPEVTVTASDKGAAEPKITAPESEKAVEEPELSIPESEKTTVEPEKTAAEQELSTAETEKATAETEKTAANEDVAQEDVSASETIEDEVAEGENANNESVAGAENSETTANEAVTAEAIEDETTEQPVEKADTVEEKKAASTIMDMESIFGGRKESNSEADNTAVPEVKVSTNKNLTQTMSLNLEKVLVTDEEMVPFESFKTVNGLEQKIKDTVVTLATTYTANGHSKTGNVMILGDDKSGKTTMAIELIKLINKKRERIGRRIAKVDAAVLNTRGIRSSMKKLMGSDLIVENAQHLRKTILNEFVAVSRYYTDDMLIVFEGETSGLKTMRNENEDICAMFDHVLVIKEYDVKEWVAYAKKYAATKNYMIDEMGTLALYKTIDDFYGKHQGIDQNDVENLINRAIKKASAKVTRKFTNLFSGKNDDTGMDILKEVDFK